MKTPHAINVMGRPYRIEYVAFDEGHYGEMQGEKGTIRIKANLPPEEWQATLVHELIHAILYESGLTHILEKENDLEEAIVRAVEHGLVRSGVIRDLGENDNV
jgi:Zn-dependent peptidase ImmA (M78 family)